MVSLDLISVRYENPLLSGTGTAGMSASAGFSQLAGGIADQYSSVFSGTAFDGLYTNRGTLASSAFSSGMQSTQRQSSGFGLPSAFAAYGVSGQSSTVSNASLAASIRQSALAAPMSLFGSRQTSLGQSLDLFA